MQQAQSNRDKCKMQAFDVTFLKVLFAMAHILPHFVVELMAGVELI